MRTNSCPRCQGSMIEGFVAYDKDGIKAVSKWIEGPPIKRWWGIKVRGKAQYDIQTWRCARCGFLESYAK